MRARIYGGSAGFLPKIFVKNSSCERDEPISPYPIHSETPLSRLKRSAASFSSECKQVYRFARYSVHRSEELYCSHREGCDCYSRLERGGAIRQLLAETPRDFAQWIIVVDNGSTDATAAVLRKVERWLPASRRAGMGKPV